MEWIWIASEFVRRVRCQMRFGHLSRAPLKLLRLELREHEAECEWVVRANDPWDRDLPARSQIRHQAEQALRDAIRLREVLFASLPEIDAASIKAYRENEGELELVISGVLERTDVVAPKIASLAMRAKLYGFRFCLEDGCLQPSRTDVEFAFSS
jgi:hypothetical protein